MEMLQENNYKLFTPLEDKILIFALPCSSLYVYSDTICVYIDIYRVYTKTGQISNRSQRRETAQNLVESLKTP